MIELQQFDGLTIDEIATRLETLGYTKFADKPPKAFAEGQTPGPQSVFLFRKPEGGPVVKFSTQPGLSEIFTALCREQDGNPFFPRILADRAIGQGLHMAVLEELKSADEMGGVQPGIARAFATLIDRSRDDHSGVYEELLKEKHKPNFLGKALKAIAGTLAHAFRDAVLIDFNARTRETGPVAGPNCVLFRTEPGKPGGQPVYAAPFRRATDEASAEKHIREICHFAGIPFPAA